MPREHATAAVLSVGDELMLGQTHDTNARWLSERLFALGLMPRERATVPDERAAIAAALRRLAAAADVVVCTGGLGPTADDLTRAALADAMGDELVEDAASLAAIERWFAGRAAAMPAGNRVQALRPRRGAALPNPNGTAPGVTGVVRVGTGGGAEREADVFCLPGPPREMRPMFEAEVVPRLRVRADRVIRTRTLHTYGLGESVLAERLGALMERSRNPLVGTTASEGIVSCRVRAEAATPEEAERLIEQAAAGVEQAAGDYLFGRDAETLAGVVVRELSRRGARVAVAESCTGGLLGAMLTQAPGSSRVFTGGWITYSNEAKMRELGVPASMFGVGAPGAVSAECARAMASGGLARAGTEAFVSVTGIAGPDGGTTEKPVGTVWIALAAGAPAATGARAVSAASEDVRRFQFRGERELVRQRAAQSALAMLLGLARGRPAPRLLWQEL